MPSFSSVSSYVSIRVEFDLVLLRFGMGGIPNECHPLIDLDDF